jgi:hypothetical protein
MMPKFPPTKLTVFAALLILVTANTALVFVCDGHDWKAPCMIMFKVLTILSGPFGLLIQMVRQVEVGNWGYALLNPVIVGSFGLGIFAVIKVLRGDSRRGKIIGYGLWALSGVLSMLQILAFAA